MKANPEAFSKEILEEEENDEEAEKPNLKVKAPAWSIEPKSKALRLSGISWQPDIDKMISVFLCNITQDKYCCNLTKDFMPFILAISCVEPMGEEVENHGGL